MKTSVFTSLVLGTVLALTGTTAGWQPTDQQESDSTLLQGTWVLESIDDHRPEHSRSIRFENDKIIGLFRDEQKKPLTLRFRLLPDRKLKGLDVGSFPAEYQGLEVHGIYQLEGNVLKLAFQPKLDARRPPPGYDLKERRPTSFDPQLVKVEVWRRTRDD